MSVFSTLPLVGGRDNEHQCADADAAKNANYLNEMTILCMSKLSMCFEFYQLLYVLYVDNKIDNVKGKKS